MSLNKRDQRTFPKILVRSCASVLAGAILIWTWNECQNNGRNQVLVDQSIENAKYYGSKAAEQVGIDGGADAVGKGIESGKGFIDWLSSWFNGESNPATAHPEPSTPKNGDPCARGQSFSHSQNGITTTGTCVRGQYKISVIDNTPR